MAEKVARAICLAAQLDPDRKGNATRWRWQEFLPEARAAVEAMQEPTEKMRRAMEEDIDWDGDAVRAYQAGIGAALDEFAN